MAGDSRFLAGDEPTVRPLAKSERFICQVLKLNDSHTCDRAVSNGVRREGRCLPRRRRTQVVR